MVRMTRLEFQALVVALERRLVIAALGQGFAQEDGRSPSPRPQLLVGQRHLEVLHGAVDIAEAHEGIRKIHAGHVGTVRLIVLLGPFERRFKRIASDLELVVE